MKNYAKRLCRIFTILFSAISLCALGPQILAEIDHPYLGLPALPSSEDERGETAKVELGQKLFFDKRLSSDGSISCASCHQPDHAFSDGRVLAQGIGLRAGTRNTPSIINSAFNTSQFWDGRRDTLEAQALDPLFNPREHGLTDTPKLLAFLRHDVYYAHAFKEAFGIGTDAIALEHLGRALASFERRVLIAGDSPFDRFYYGGDKSALSPAAAHGLRLFQGAAQCATCHVIGPDSALFTDNDFHSLSIGLKSIEKRLPEITTRLVKMRSPAASLDQTVLSDQDIAELGRFAVTLKPVDIGKFRTPSLRNVALTAPYMHDGSIATLDEAVEQEVYYRGTEAGHPLILTPSEKADLVEFLKSLNSSVNRRFDGM